MVNKPYGIDSRDPRVRLFAQCKRSGLADACRQMKEDLARRLPPKGGVDTSDKV
jgi:hypothetical protein